MTGPRRDGGDQPGRPVAMARDLRPAVRGAKRCPDWIGPSILMSTTFAARHGPDSQPATNRDPGGGHRQRSGVGQPFAVYGYFVPVISRLFFPNQTPLISLLLTFSVFGVGFVMRPVGSLVFGHTATAMAASGRLARSSS